MTVVDRGNVQLAKATQQKTVLTGIKPTGIPHIGNYLGAIQPAITLTSMYNPFYFIADYHAITTMKDAHQLRDLTYQIAAAWLALGLDPEQVVFYRQSDIPEIFELHWILSCSTSKGLLNRAHAYKTLVQARLDQNKPEDEGINAGLYNYPVLMAADILLFKTHVVPVGSDQKQHVEIARDIAEAFNSEYSDIFVVPEPLIQEDTKLIPGLDGRKMSKNYKNVIPIFLPSKALRKIVMKIVTDSKTVEEPKDPESCTVFQIFQQFASEADTQALRTDYEAGGLGYGQAKERLFNCLDQRFMTARATYDEILVDKAYLDKCLLQGAQKARDVAAPMLAQVRSAIGIGSTGSC